jgi:4-amino-4-deoxy-L-arabinose transferase-like glycosyltransferase
MFHFLQLTRLVRVLLILSAGWYIVTYLYIALSRIAYPFDLQWMEGGMVDHVRRVMTGQSLYVAPGVEFVPYIYTPLYFYVSAAVSAVTGAGYFPLRLVSLAAALVSFALIGALIWRETRSTFAGWLGAGFFAGTFVLGGAWFDLARIDMLMLALTLAGIYAAKSETWHGALVSGVLLALAALTKQTALAIAVPLAVYYLLVDRRLFLIFAGITGGLMAASTLALDAMSDGWYSYYAFVLPRQHPWVMDMLIDFWLVDLLPVVIAGGLGVVYLLLGGYRTLQTGSSGIELRRFAYGRQEVQDFLFYGLLAGGMVGSAWLSRLHEGGYINVLIPAFAMIAVLFGLGVHRLAAQQPAGRRMLIYGLCIVQFAVLIYSPADHIPTRADRAAGEHLVEAVAEIDGEVWMVHRGYIASLAGKESIYAHRMGIEDVMRGDEGEIRDMLAADIQQAIAEQRFDAIIFDGSRDDFILVDYYFENLQEHYIGLGEIFPAEFDGTFWPLTGLQVRPYYVFVPMGQ